MENQKKIYIVIGIVVLVLVAALFVWQRTGSAAGPMTIVPIATTSNVTVQKQGDITASGRGNYTITKISSTPSSIPDFKASVVFSLDISADVRAVLNARLAATQAEIGKDTNDFNTWITLGGLYKMGGDYQHALTMWNYASLTWPKNSVSFANLGDLYMNFLHDYSKANSNYLTDVKNSPGSIESYVDLFNLYTSGKYTPSAMAAEDILKKGIQANPTSIELPVTLARYFVSKGNISEAKVQFELAMKNAQVAGQTNLVSDLQNEEASL